MNDQGDSQGCENEAQDAPVIDGSQQQAGADADIAKVLHSLNSSPSLALKSRFKIPEIAVIAQKVFGR
jgi:hypothetical protein